MSLLTFEKLQCVPDYNTDIRCVLCTFISACIFGKNPKTPIRAPWFTLGSIEGFHDAVRTPYALRPRCHVGFFWNNKICFNFVSILFEKIKFMVSERTYIIVPMM